MMFYSAASVLAAIGGLAGFPPKPGGVTVLELNLSEGARISYKENTIRDSTPGVESYAGYVHLAPKPLEELGVPNQKFEINTFFWFSEARRGPETVENGTALIINWIVVDENTKHMFPDTLQPGTPVPTVTAPPIYDTAVAGHFSLGAWKAFDFKIPFLEIAGPCALLGRLVVLL